MLSSSPMRGVRSFVCSLLFGCSLVQGAVPGFTFGAGGSPVNPSAVVPTDNAATAAVGSSLNPDVVSPGYVSRVNPEPTTTNSAFVFSGVNTATGNYYQSTLDMLADLEGLSFVFERFYNSLDPYNDHLGQGWTHSYDITIQVLQNGNLILKDRGGIEIPFKPASGGKFTPTIPGVFDVLKARVPATDGYILTRADQRVFTFSPSGHLQMIEDEAGNFLQLRYMAQPSRPGFFVIRTITHKNGRVFNFTYNSLGQLISILDTETGETVQYGYDQGGRLTSFTDTLNATTQYEYSGELQESEASDGLLESVTNALGQTVVQNSYDAQDRVQSQIDGSEETTLFAYASGQTTITDPRGNIVRHLYSGFKLIAIIDQLGHKIELTYNARNLLVTRKEPGSIIRYTYDARGNLTGITNATGNQTVFTYNARNDLLSVRDPLGRITRFTYDAEGNRTSATDPLGNKTSFKYDADGNLLEVIDANGNSTKYSYNAEGRLVTVTDAKGQVTQYTYDELGDRTAIINAKQNTTALSHDSYHRLTSITDPLGFRTSYEYDAAGNMESVTDANERTTEFTHDTQSRRTSILYPGGQTVQFVYDENGNRQQMTDELGTTLYRYDDANRLTQVTFPSGKKVTYGYDAAGNMTSITYPDGKIVRYQYDSARRLTRVTDWDGRATVYTYNAAGEVIKVAYPNQAAIRLTYNAASRITQVQNDFTGGSTPAAQSIKRFAYVYDAVGNVLKITDGNGNDTTFTYDKLNQLTSFTKGGQTTQYTYDAVGNRTNLQSPSANTAYTYDAADRLVQAGAITFEYDSNGSLIKKNTLPNPVEYRFNSANRLVLVDDGSVRIRFTYDGDGNRALQRIGTSTIEFVNDVSTPLVTVLAENGPEGNISYVRGRALISGSSPSFEFFPLYDVQRTVVGAVNNAGLLNQTYGYDPFGITTAIAGSLGNSNKFRYTGEALEPSPDIYYLRTRYYDPKLGRFLSKDPFLGFDTTPITQNLYVYGRNNPVRYTDPTGLVVCDLVDEVSWPCAPSIWDW